ncbi:glycogen debranching N-terminal domain-containing protein [Brevundimonas abyssalis]|uniref:glycogen debranching N-terminal domain-containing protein n=1 Tax=Brevundimonas abyssalis TaxID=1125965 RepID=UPI001F599098|nr:glycogen debranching N-terminal domain-containing protein [Brevundimonas abyssalis]
MDDATAIPAADLVTEGVVLDRLLALKEGDTFLVADPWGDLRGGADGLFDRDSRILSRLVLLVGHDRPSRLSSAVSDDNVFFTCHATNRPLPPMGGRSAPGGVIHVERRRFLWDRRLYERVRLTNHGVDPIVAPLSFEYGADFRDIFEVRGTRRERRGRTRPPVADGGRVQFGYEAWTLWSARPGCRSPNRRRPCRPSARISGSACRAGSSSTCSWRRASKAARRRAGTGGGWPRCRPVWPCGPNGGAAPRCGAPTVRASTSGWTSPGRTWPC